MIRVATIGTNFITEWFLDAAKKCNNVQYIASYSRSPEKAKQFAVEHGAPLSFCELEKLAGDPRIDAVYIASPNSLHYGHAKMMLEHGKHVLCEKTVTSNQDELARLIKTAKEHRVVLLEALRSVHTSGFLAVKNNLSRLGKIRMVNFQYCQYSSRYDHFKNGVTENAFDPVYSNGALMDIGVYCIRPLVMLFGMPCFVSADAIRLSNGVDGAGTIVASYKDMVAEISYSKISNGGVPSQIQGEDGTMVIRDIHNPHQILLYGRRGEAEELIGVDESIDMYSEINDWVSLIADGQFDHEDLEFSSMQMQLMDIVRRQVFIRFPADEHPVIP